MKKLIIKFIRKSPLLYRWIKKSWFFLNNYNNIDNILCEKCNKTSAFYHHKNITLKRDAGSSCVCGINLRNNAELKVIKDFIFLFFKKIRIILSIIHPVLALFMNILKIKKIILVLIILMM